MSSTSIAPGPGEAARKPIASLATAAGVAFGQPVDELPPLVEPTGFAEAPAPVLEGRRAPRRSFLAPVARPAEPPRPEPPTALGPAVEPPRPEPPAPFEIPPLIEPVAAPR